MSKFNQFRSKRRIPLPLIILVVLLAVFTLAVNLEPGELVLSLKGEETMVLEYGEVYSEPGAEAFFMGSIFTRRALDIPISIQGETDVLPGEYAINYSARFRGRSASVTRKVIIRDTTPPRIILQTKEGQLTLPGEEYQEEGYAAYDKLDGDLTGRVLREDLGNGTVRYSVTDSHGNTATAIRNIEYFDDVPPELTLLGRDVIYVIKGRPYEDPGYIAKDNLDGDISTQVVINGKVDTERLGEYFLSYVSTDAHGNESSASRRVIVREKASDIPINPGEDGSKVIYLTFDDGPGPYTEELLALLDKYGVKATFFVTNQRPEYNYILSLEAAAGHSVGIHTATHSKEIYSSEEAFFNDLNTMAAIIKEQTGSDPNLLRFAFGSSNTISSYNPGIMTRLAKLVEEKGYYYFDWNVSSGDGNYSIETEQAYSFVINGIRDRSVSYVLMHDLNKNSMAAVEDIIIWALDNGYTFLPIDCTSPVCHHRIAN